MCCSVCVTLEVLDFSRAQEGLPLKSSKPEYQRHPSFKKNLLSIDACSGAQAKHVLNASRHPEGSLVVEGQIMDRLR